MIRLAVLGSCLLALTLGALSLHVPGALGVGSIRLKTWFVVISGTSALFYLAAVFTVLRRPAQTRAVWLVLLVAAALRLPLIVAPPFLSTDIYRYVWDGRVQAAGVNPYRYLPADPALASLRDPTVYPYINRAEYAPTIYPPAAEALYAAVAFVSSNLIAVKATMVGFEILAVYCLLRLLGLAGLPPERVLIYAWNPLPVWAFAGNGHIDAAAIGLVAAALLLRVLHRDSWAGTALGLAILTKFLPAVIAPVLWRRRTGWRTAAAALATIALLYAAYSGVGLRVFGFLQGYGSEEGYDSGAGFWLLAGLSRIMTLPPAAAIIYKAVAALLLAAFGAWFAFVRRPDNAVSICAAAGVMMAVLSFAISPHYPWYFAWLAVPCVLAPTPAVLWMATAPILLYLDTFGDRFVWPSVVFVPALGLALAGLRPKHTAEPIKGTT
ncbi:glycosyltransferase 87 family protein [Rhodopila sp.]|uniref:glycosyltransferase 87 family protein n=1 Tax=Rhodopila sp. TaxID=2480087 RepID=UPI003D133654